MSDEIRRNMALFPIGIVMKLTDLTARQIRYYEQHGLIAPARTPGNQRQFSLNDIERLLEIKALIEKGVNIAGIRQMLQPAQKTSVNDTVAKSSETSSKGSPAVKSEGKSVTKSKAKSAEKTRELTDSELHQILKRELLAGKLRPGEVSLIQGELTRFFK